MANKIRYVRLRKGYKTFEYRRHLPEELRPFYDHKSHLVLSLKTTDFRIAEAAAIRISKQFDANLASIKAGQTPVPIEIYESQPDLQSRSKRAQAFLDKYFQLHYANVTDPVEVYTLMDEVEDIIRDGTPTDELSTKQKELGKDVLTLLQGGIIEEDLTIPQYINRYLELKGEEVRDTKNFRLAGEDWLSFNPHNPPISRIRKDDARRFRDNYSERGKAAATAKRRFNCIRAAINFVNDNDELVTRNVFENVSFKIEEKERVDVPQELYKQLIFDADTSDQISLVHQIQINTGMRVSEVTGLLKSDIKTDPNGILYVDIAPHPHRSLKTKSSRRRIPLVGISKTAVEKRLSDPRNKTEYLFPRWIKDGQLQSTSAANAVNKRYKEITSHQHRHSLNTRLRRVNAPEYFLEKIQGHSPLGMSGRYGKDDLIPEQLAWLEKVAL
jgi:integrase